VSVGNDIMEAPFRGLIDEVTIWALGSAEGPPLLGNGCCARSISGYSKPLGSEQGLRAYFPFDEGRGSVVRDHASAARRSLTSSSSHRNSRKMWAAMAMAPEEDVTAPLYGLLRPQPAARFWASFGAPRVEGWAEMAEGGAVQIRLNGSDASGRTLFARLTSLPRHGELRRLSAPVLTRAVSTNHSLANASAAATAATSSVSAASIYDASVEAAVLVSGAAMGDALVLGDSVEIGSLVEYLPHAGGSHGVPADSPFDAFTFSVVVVSFKDAVGGDSVSPQDALVRLFVAPMNDAPRLVLPHGLTLKVINVTLFNCDASIYDLLKTW